MKISTKLEKVPGSRLSAVVLAASVLSLSLFAASATAAAKGPTLVVYSAQGYDAASVKAFLKTNPGFNVTLNDNSTGPLLQQIQAEGSNPKWGVLWVDGATAFAQLDDEGMLVKHEVPRVSFNKVGKENVPADGSYVPTGLTATGALVYDSSQITAAQLPTTWADLLEPQYKGELGMNDPAQSGPTFPLIAGLMNFLGDYPVTGSIKKAISAGEDFLTQLKANGLVVNATNGPTISAIEAHQIKMAIVQSSAGYGQELTTSPSIRVAYLSPVTALPSVIGIDAKAPKKVRAEAQKFVDWVMSKAGQHVMQTGDPEGDSLFWPVLKGETPSNSVLPALANVPAQTINPYVWGPKEATINAWFESNINNG
jgi:iron(III) transport system substrate-binding protein